MKDAADRPMTRLGLFARNRAKSAATSYAVRLAPKTERFDASTTCSSVESLERIVETISSVREFEHWVAWCGCAKSDSDTAAMGECVDPRHERGWRNLLGE
jgi:hypothetical protein